MDSKRSSDLRASLSFVSVESEEIIFNCSARGCPLTLTVNDLFHPKGLLFTSFPTSVRPSLNLFNNETALDALARLSLK